MKTINNFLEYNNGAFEETSEIKRMRAVMNEDENTAEEYARLLMQKIIEQENGTYCEWNIFNPKAEITGNFRAKDNYFEGSKTLDVWISFIAFNSYYGCYEVGAYLTDIWQLSPDKEYNKELFNHMYMNVYKKVQEKKNEIKKEKRGKEMNFCELLSIIENQPIKVTKRAKVQVLVPKSDLEEIVRKTEGDLVKIPLKLSYSTNQEDNSGLWFVKGEEENE